MEELRDALVFQRRKSSTGLDPIDLEMRDPRSPLFEFSFQIHGSSEKPNKLRRFACQKSISVSMCAAFPREILFHADGDNITHGTPLIEGATVEGEILEQRKDKKVIAFKYRRRKGYHRTVGHRRKLTRVKITGIRLGGKTSKPKKPAKSEE